MKPDYALKEGSKDLIFNCLTIIIIIYFYLNFLDKIIYVIESRRKYFFRLTPAILFYLQNNIVT